MIITEHGIFIYYDFHSKHDGIYSGSAFGFSPSGEEGLMIFYWHCSASKVMVHVNNQ